MNAVKGCRASLLVLLLLAAPVQAGAAGRTEKSFRLVQQTPDGWEIEYTPARRSLTPVVIESKTYYRFADPSPSEVATDVAGGPALPADAIVLGIPPDALLEAELLEVEFEEMPKTPIAPHPAYEFTEEQEAVEVFLRDPRSYAAAAFVPSSLVSVEPAFTLRQQRIGTVRVRPYQYHPSTETLRRIIRAIVRVRLRVGKELRAWGQPLPDPQFEQTFRSLLLNYEQAKAWRISGKQPPALPDPTRDWFETGSLYYKVPVASDGWYKITPADIAAAGGNPSAINVATVKVFHRGVQIPVVVRPDTTVEFHARRNRGDSTYIDFYTDTSAYWLTWAGTPGARFLPDSVTGTPSSQIVSATHSAHVEENFSYYFGTTTNEQVDNNTFPGETWVWRFFNVNNQVDFPFVLDSVDAAATTVTIRARVWGTGVLSPPAVAQHKARFWLNDSLLGDVDFSQRQPALLNVTVPATFLKSGTNILRLRNMDTGTGGNQFYFDWFEVDYQRLLRASNNQMVFVSPATSGGAPVEFLVRGFTSPQIEVYDLTGQRAIGGVTVSGDSASGFSVAFRDTFSTQRTYVALTTNSPRSVLPLRQKMFSDIRVNSQGADYLIVTHRNFLVQANQLAAHRQTTDGVRVAVVDVADVYDEFNYGMFSTIPIKTFLRHAYLAWPGPAVAYVLFFGDANWDYHRYFSNTIKHNYVPAYGVPTGDNWFGCFDSVVTFIPSMYIGRLPVENAVQAQNVVNKIIAYENHDVAEWNKNFLFITGGNNLSEQSGFNFLSETSINGYVAPPPFGGSVFRVYKTTAGYVGGERKQELKNLFKRGLVFVNFVGHSGGRIWGVDPGPASELENTNGSLPFVSSVSCNVGGFASSANNVFAEDLVLADNRGAIASWASSSLGYATYGAALTNNWLANATVDSVRAFGKLTTNARYRLWVETGSGTVTVAMVNLNPLIGDPLAKFAVPLKPDLAVAPSGIMLNKPLPTPNDSALSVKVRIRNFGLVPTDSVGLTLKDIYNGHTAVLVNKKLKPTYHVDSLMVPWRGMDSVGLHALTATVDPDGLIGEVSEINNVASSDQYVYANNVFVVKPLNNAVVPPGVQSLVVTSPVGYDSAGFSYFFELDTVDTFDSPALVSSGAVLPEPIKGKWDTPSLPADKLYFWRVRTMHGSLAGNWVISAFATSTDLPLSRRADVPLVRLRESRKAQFVRSAAVNATATDSGVTIAPSVPLRLYCRSVGFRYNQSIDYYSVLGVNDQTALGLWWEIGNSFLVMRVNDFTGNVTFRNFPVSSNASQADSMRSFILATPPGNYLGVVVIFDGQNGVTENLKQAMDSLGATLFRSIVYGQSYSFIGRRGIGGPWMTPLEQLTNDTAIVSLDVPNYYSLGAGSISSIPFPVPQSWNRLRWNSAGDAGRTDVRLAILGMRTNGVSDTLRMIPRDSLDVDLSFLDTVTSAAPFGAMRVTGYLSTSDANITPSFVRWEIDCAMPPDLAVSAQTLGETDAINYHLPVTVHNIGYQPSDSVRVDVTAFDKNNRSLPIATFVLDSIGVDASRSAVVPVSTVGFAHKTILRVNVAPLHHGRDLIAENNTAYHTLRKSNIVPHSRPHVFADGKRLMDGDFIPPSPTILVRLDAADGETPATATVSMAVNHVAVEAQSAPAGAKNATHTASPAEEFTFMPRLATGEHQLRFLVARMNARGDIDTVVESILVRVSVKSRILDVQAYPNPFGAETRITFMLAGSRPPDEVRIRFFTVAGRRIRDIQVPGSFLQIGFNAIPWDGRDADGDEIANGYYFYELSVMNEGKRESSIHKIVKLR